MPEPATNYHRVAAHRAFQAWREDHDTWDGNALYVDADTAKAHAAYDYQGDEYGHWDDEERRSRPDFTWDIKCNAWRLLDHGQDTHVRVGETHVWRQATPEEAAEQDEERAAAYARYMGAPPVAAEPADGSAAR